MKMALVFIVILLLSCSGQQASGPSSVETQNSIAGSLVLPNGNALSHTKIQLLLADQASATPLQETITDTLGHYSFSIADSSYYSVVAMGDSGVYWRDLRRAILQPDTQAVIVHSTKPIIVYLRLLPFSWGVGQVLDVHVLGVGERGAWLTDSIFTLTLPGNGEYAIRFVGSSGLREEFVRVNSSDTIQIAPALEKSFALLDFESSCMQNNLRLFTGESWNFIVVETGVLEPQAAIHNFGLVCNQDVERGGFARIAFTATGSEPWAVIGSVLGGGGHGINLSQMDSVEFWAKGSGSAHLGFVTADMRSFADYKHVRSPDFLLNEQWTRYVYAIDDFAYPFGSEALQNGLKWIQSAEQTLFLQFNLMTSGELSIDGVRIFGLSYENL